MTIISFARFQEERLNRRTRVAPRPALVPFLATTSAIKRSSNEDEMRMVAATRRRPDLAAEWRISSRKWERKEIFLERRRQLAASEPGPDAAATSRTREENKDSRQTEPALNHQQRHNPICLPGGGGKTRKWDRHLSHRRHHHKLP
ncbi:unnamed protein product [Musa acuminata subsp. burmannicoides]